MSIETGDLVMLVRGHACALNAIGGVPMVVGHTHPASEWFMCSTCGSANVRAPAPWAELEHPPHTWNLPLPWLKKFEPPAESIRAEAEYAVAAAAEYMKKRLEAKTA